MIALESIEKTFRLTERNVKWPDAKLEAKPASLKERKLYFGNKN